MDQDAQGAFIDGLVTGRGVLTHRISFDDRDLGEIMMEKNTMKFSLIPEASSLRWERSGVLALIAEVGTAKQFYVGLTAPGATFGVRGVWTKDEIEQLREIALRLARKRLLTIERELSSMGIQIDNEEASDVSA